MNQRSLAEQIGRRFRNFRISRGLQQRNIGDMLGVSHGNISRLERGVVYRFSACFLDKCRTELGLSIDWLVTGQSHTLLPHAQLTGPCPRLDLASTRRRDSGLAPVGDEDADLQQKLDELRASLIRATELVQELFAQAASQGRPAKSV